MTPGLCGLWGFFCVDLLGLSLLGPPRNGLWLGPFLPISTLHLWYPLAESIPAFRTLTPAWQGVGYTKKLDWKRGMKWKGFFLFFWVEWGKLKTKMWNELSAGVNPGTSSLDHLAPGTGTAPLTRQGSTAPCYQPVCIQCKTIFVSSVCFFSNHTVF